MCHTRNKKTQFRSETFCNNCEEFLTSIPTLEEKFKVIYSGGEKQRRGVGFILNHRMDKSVLYYDNKSERLACIKIQAKPCNILIIQTYAPNEDAEEEEKEEFYEDLIKLVKEHKKSRDKLIIMGDWNGKVRENIV